MPQQTSLSSGMMHNIQSDSIHLMTTPSLKEKTAKGLLWGSINSGAQQVLNLVFGIFLARLLSPADYGMVGMLTIFTLIASTLQESGFISGLNRKKTITDADYNAVFWFNVLCSLTIYIILFFSAPLIAAWFRQPILVPLSRLSFLSFVISALNTSPRAWLFRNMRVRETAILSTVALIVSGITGITLAWNGFAYWGIAIQNLTFCTMLTIGSWWYADWHPTLHIDLPDCWQLISLRISTTISSASSSAASMAKRLWATTIKPTSGPPWDIPCSREWYGV